MVFNQRNRNSRPAQVPVSRTPVASSSQLWDDDEPEFGGYADHLHHPVRPTQLGNGRPEEGFPNGHPVRQDWRSAKPAEVEVDFEEVEDALSSVPSPSDEGSYQAELSETGDVAIDQRYSLIPKGLRSDTRNLGHDDQSGAFQRLFPLPLAQRRPLLPARQQRDTDALIYNSSQQSDSRISGEPTVI
ncbi:unnamed protein product [Protopolystoma xenopodis]|uniref:Uncharacterized protein n=1 Tax=Protopolystoma xenopodis TaxID=117903 RepID=A0A3S5AUK0_9PLAT|nr:unnamed protein product [Protopolystoma xenopodis]